MGRVSHGWGIRLDWMMVLYDWVSELLLLLLGRWMREHLLLLQMDESIGVWGIGRVGCVLIHGIGDQWLGTVGDTRRSAVAL